MSTAEQAHAVLTRYADAWTAGDAAALFASYHDDVVFHYFGQNPLAGVHRGKPAALAVLMDATRRTRRSLKTVVGVMAGEGGRGCILARETVMRGMRRSRSSGPWSTGWPRARSWNAGCMTRTRR
jgi:ketosteroid isomerase-like protein